MGNKKSKKAEIKAKKLKAQKKEKSILLIGIIVFCLAMSQVLLIGFYYFGGNRNHNQIIIEDNVLTTEICTEWFNYTSTLHNEVPGMYYNYSFNFQEYPIPTDVVIEVCDKWKKIKDRIDSEVNESG